jgi:protoheme IX farnesyltransferase
MPTAYGARVTSNTIMKRRRFSPTGATLTKPHVMSLVVFTGLCGGGGGAVHPVLGFAAVLCIALGAGSAGALNQWYEADLDAQMKRTAKRPLPAGRMDRQTALHFGVGLAVFSVILMDLAANHLAAAILAVSILFYGLHRMAEAPDGAEHRRRRRGPSRR